MEALPSTEAAPTDPKGSATISSVERAADVLLHFVSGGASSFGVTELSRDLGLSKAAVHRILASLRSRGLIAFSESTRRYSLGPMALALGLRAMGDLDLRQIAAPKLAELSAAFDETATLSVPLNGARIYLEQVTPRRELAITVAMGVPYPLHSGASSKAFLAFMTPDEIDEYFTHRLDALTDRTVTDQRELRAELELIRTRGWSRSEGERQSGAAAVAAPVFDHLRRPIAVMSVCGPATRFPVDEAATVVALRAATAEVSKNFGYVER